MSALFTRALRMISLYLWLWGRHWAAGPALFVLVLVTGLMARIGRILVFILTVRGALWLLRPDSIPPWLQRPWPYPPDAPETAWLLIAMPGVAMLILAGVGFIHSRCLTRIAALTGNRLASQALRAEINRIHAAGAASAPTPVLTRQVQGTFNKVYARSYQSSRQFILLLIGSVSLVIALAIAAYIQSTVTGVVAGLFILCNLVAFTIFHARARDANVRHDRLAYDLRDLQMDLYHTARAALEQRETPGAVDDLVARHRTLSVTMGRSRGQLQEFLRATQGFIEAAILVILLIILYREGTNLDPETLGSFLILILVLRFVLGQISGVFERAVAISANYVLLTSLMSKEALDSIGNAPVLEPENEPAD